LTSIIEIFFFFQMHLRTCAGHV